LANESNAKNFVGTNGKSPQSQFIADSLGNLYGTTQSGGNAAPGTVSELSNAGFIVVPEPASVLVFSPILLSGLLGRRRHRQ
jgi:uncharacterized repeat protein (TIGR03803 family)